jgi:hypothetical protein
MKWNLPYSIGQLKPDVVVKWYGTIPESTPYVGRHYREVQLLHVSFYVRVGSHHIRGTR